MQTRRWIYQARPTAEFTPACYRLETSDEDLDLVRGEVLVRGAYWSVDPCMRIQQSHGDTWEAPHPLESVQGGAAVGQILEVVGPGVTTLAAGDWVECYWAGAATDGRRRRTVAAWIPRSCPFQPRCMSWGCPDGSPSSGCLRRADRVRGNADRQRDGGVGSIVGQLGRLAGMRVVGIVGSEAKGRWIVDELGFDAAINYRDHPDARSMQEALAQRAPDGIDVYYDNTGGITTDAVIQGINLRARLIICGQISQYQGGLVEPALGPRLLQHFLYKRATMQGVLARDYTARMDEMLRRMGPWVRDGSIRYRETIIEGFERLPEALCGLFTGANVSKMMVAETDG
ncbi:MAG: NADP-dependent oxidoreductase [Pseudomonadota bacterium]